MLRMATSVWDQVLGRIETKVNRHSFYTWFKPTSFVADTGGSLTVRVPNTLFKDWLTKHYSVVLSEALAEVGRPGTSVVFVAEGAPVEPQADAAAAPEAFELEPPAAESASRTDVVTLSQISSGSCSTQPGSGKCCGNSVVCRPNVRPSVLMTSAVVPVVP